MLPLVARQSVSNSGWVKKFIGQIAMATSNDVVSRSGRTVQLTGLEIVWRTLCKYAAPTALGRERVARDAK